MARRLVPALSLAGLAVLAAFVALGSAAVNVPQSGWSWGNPTPQGDTLRAIDFVGGRGYAAGDAGSVLRTDDGGATWTGLVTGTGFDLARLQVIDAQTLVAIGGNGCVLRRSDDAGASFHKIFSVTDEGCPAPLAAATFVNKDVGYLLLNDGSVLRTTDGGQTFSRQTAIPGTPASNNPTGAHAVDLAFTNPENGIVFVTPQGNGPSIAYSTTDAGISWKPVDAVEPGHVARIYFVDSKNGYAVGTDTLLRTDDGGASWKQQPAGVGRPLTSIRCTDVQTCLMTTQQGDVLLRTTDGGQTATAITASSQPIYAAAFASATRVVAVGAGGATVVSDDGGVNYTPISHDIGGTYEKLEPGPAPSSAFALGERGGLAVTTDAGATWKTLGIPTSSRVVATAFPTSTTGYGLDATGALFKTANGGTTWSTLDTGTTTATRALAAPDADTVVLVGPRGIRRGTGSTAPQAVGGRAVAKAALDAVSAHGPLLVAYSSFGKSLFLSRNGGSTWTAIRRPTKKTAIGGQGLVDFVSARTGFLVDSAQRLWKTANGGKSWTQLLGDGTSDALAISMGSGGEGFIAVRQFGPGDGSAYVLRTSDGGRTWRPQAIARGALNAVLATGPQQGYALVGERGLFITSTGGDAGAPSTLAVKTPVKAFTYKAFKKAKGRVRVTGTLAGALGGERIVVSRRDLAGGRWSHQVVTAGANGGGFTTSWSIRRSSVFVAQWSGDSGRRGAGSQPLVVSVQPKPKKKR